MAVSDLCGLVAARDPLLRQAAQAEDLTVAACYPRAVRWLFRRAGAPLDERRARILNLRTESADAIAAAIEPAPGPARPERLRPLGGGPKSGWRPWFPVIDYARCTGCGQCKEFCLFGVFAQADDGRVEVCAPDACKDNCPACARMCPAAAIMFPKLDEHSPISGSEDAPAAAGGKVRLTREALFGAGALDRLRARQRPPLLK